MLGPWIRFLLFVSATLIALQPQALAYLSDKAITQSDTGQCYADVVLPARYALVEVQELVRPETVRTRHIPARTQREWRRVQIKEATTAYETRPPIYETIEETVMVAPERDVLVDIPAEYETWTETVIVEPEVKERKAAPVLYVSGLAGVGLGTMARTYVAPVQLEYEVTHPALTKEIKRTRLTALPRKEWRKIPAKYQVIKRQVLRSNANFKTRHIPVQYASIPVDIVIEPARTVKEIIPAQYQTVERETRVSPQQRVQRQVLCGIQGKQAKIAEIQTALTRSGYTVAIDGLYGPQTHGAITKFQEDVGLATGALTYETINALLLKPDEPPPASLALAFGQYKA